MSPVTPAEPVIIIHGLWMPGLVMGWLTRRIAQDGFAARSYAYPTMRLTLSENAERFARYCTSLAAPRVHIVAHSMGGLVALKMLQMNRQLRCGRLVLIGTPYTGSFAAQRLARWPGGHTLLGRSIAEWLREPRPAPDGVAEIGIIAGTRGYGLGRLVAPDLPQPNDGVVALAETAIPGVTRRIELKVGHTGMLVSREVARQCCAFLHNGRFI
ncbi:MAG: alpha/beta hydrolase [Burkholderiales bacterium]|jgi:pimeloyl-ACP methyl ester carboxylesterase|nr:alpha/beta hydrolase [Burkholderiales bacterium]